MLFWSDIECSGVKSLGRTTRVRSKGSKRKERASRSRLQNGWNKGDAQRWNAIRNQAKGLEKRGRNTLVYHREVIGSARLLRLLGRGVEERPFGNYIATVSQLPANALRREAKRRKGGVRDPRPTNFTHPPLSVRILPFQPWSLCAPPILSNASCPGLRPRWYVLLRQRLHPVWANWTGVSPLREA